MGKLPGFIFYPGDWLRDGVAGCSLEAQGLWLRMMIVAHDGERYGYLSHNGKPIPPEALARRCGATSLEQFLSLMAELDAAGVPRRSPSGVIYSKRMVDDDKARSKNRNRVRKFRKTQVNCNGHVMPSVTPLSEDENVSEMVYELLKIYPTTKHKTKASFIEESVACESLARDGKELVFQGTRTFAAAFERWPISERKFAMGFVKFMESQEYLADPVKWERGEVVPGKCALHPNSGLTQNGTCWDCYQAKYSSGASA